MSLSVYFTFLLACIVVVIVPGPTVTLIVANSLRHGRRAGMLNVAGTQFGLVLTVGIVSGPGITDRGDGRVVHLAASGRRGVF